MDVHELWKSRIEEALRFSHSERMLYARFGDLHLKQELLYLYFHLATHIPYLNIPQNTISMFVESNDSMTRFMKKYFPEYFSPEANKYCADIFETVLAISNGTESHELVLEYYYNYLDTRSQHGYISILTENIEEKEKLLKLLRQCKFNWRKLASVK